MNDICRTQERQAMALARTNDPQTSKDAAKKMVESGELNRQEKQVYKAIKNYSKFFPDFTTKDIGGWLTSTYQSPYHQLYDICRRRFSGLENKGKIEPIQIDGIKTHPKGNPVYKRRDGCRVWRLL